MDSPTRDPVLSHFTAMARRIVEGDDPFEVADQRAEFLERRPDPSPWEGAADRVWWDLSEITDLPRARPGEEREEAFLAAVASTASRWLAVDQNDPGQVGRFFEEWRAPIDDEIHPWDHIEAFYQGDYYVERLVDRPMLHLTRAIMASGLRDQLDGYADVWGLSIWPRGSDCSSARSLRWADDAYRSEDRHGTRTCYPARPSVAEQADVARQLANDAWGIRTGL